MAATTFSAVAVAPHRSLSRAIALYAKEAKYELLKNIRIPVYAISTVAFPVMFYVLFGIVLGSNAADRKENATYLLATMGCFGVIAVALFGFGVSLAMERGQGWLQVKRASPMPVSAYFLGKLCSAVVFSTVIMLLLLTIGFAFFSAMGMAIGYFAKPNSAPGLVNLIYLPMSFCSGLWIPLFLLPRGLQTFAKLLPPYHLSQLALNAVGMVNNPTPAWGHVEALIAFTLICLGLAAWGYWRDEGKTYG